MDFTLNKIGKYVDNHTSLDQRMKDLKRKLEQLNEDASRKIKEVEELINQRRQFHGGLVVDNPQWTGQVLSTTILSDEAVKAFIEEIWWCLMDDEVRKIGVWGWVAWGKQEMSIAKLQKDITSKIGVAFCGDEDETTRAGMLLETLMLRKSRFVMILDDLWEKVSLERIGIPEPFVGSKLVLTTRSLMCVDKGGTNYKINCQAVCGVALGSNYYSFLYEGH
ncbi:hypothetical protein V6N13_014232 [Hibiscus sabdariffa]